MFLLNFMQDTEKLLEQLARDQQAVDQVHNVVQKEEEIMNEEARRVQAIADEAQTDLDNVLPQLEMAITALDSLDKSDISEIRVYTKPPPMVMTVLGAVCVLLQQKPDWNTAKLLLGDQGFLKRLVQYDKNAVPDKVFTRLKRCTYCKDEAPILFYFSFFSFILSSLFSSFSLPFCSLFFVFVFIFYLFNFFSFPFVTYKIILFIFRPYKTDACVFKHSTSCRA